MATRQYFVYVDWRIDTWEAIYVGIGSRIRFLDDRRNTKHTGIVAKCGAIRELVYKASDWKDACACEIRLIRELKTFHYDDPNGHGCNFTRGGEGGFGFPGPWKGKRRSEATRAKMSLAKKGKRPNNAGQSKSKNALKKLSESMKRYHQLRRSRVSSSVAANDHSHRQ